MVHVGFEEAWVGHVGEKGKGRKGFGKHYYAIAPGMENSPLWRRPAQTLYPSLDWTRIPPEVKRSLRARYR